MRRFTWALLVMAAFFAFGCGSKQPDPPPLDDGARAAIAQEDADVAAEESQQHAPAGAQKK